MGKDRRFEKRYIKGKRKYMSSVKSIWSAAITISLIFIALSDVTHAIKITEIAYDLEGSDSSREWIEIYNDTSIEVSIDSIFLLEGEVHHKIRSTDSEEILILPGSYAILADNPDSFLTDNPLHIGALFDSSFSLKNISGEELAITNKEKKILHRISYTSSQGANGDGNTLHILSNGEIIAGPPSPGSRYAVHTRRNFPSESASTQNNTEIFIKVTEPLFRNVINHFTAVKLVFGREILQEVRWNLGDGVDALGSGVFHRYTRNGTYLVNISDIYTGNVIATKKLTVVDPNIALMQAGDSLLFVNNSTEDLEVSKWIFLSTFPSKFQFPENSFVQAGGSIVIPVRIRENDRIEIRSPLGKLILKVDLQKKESVNASLPVASTKETKREEDVVAEKEDFTSEIKKSEIKLVLSKNNLWIWLSALLLLLIIALLPLVIENKFKK